MTTELIDVITPPSTGVARGRVRPGYLVLGLALLGIATAGAIRYDTGVSSVLLFALLPDVALLAGIGGAHQPGQLPRRAVPFYNLMHHPLVPVALALLVATGLAGTYWLVAAVTWAGHIAVDRGVGYGPRTRDGWQRG